MTILLTIPISEDLKAAFESARPGETIEQAVEQFLRAEVAKQRVTLPTTGSLIEMARRIRQSSAPITTDEAHALRIEGRP